MALVALKQLAQSGAGDGARVVWSDTLSAWTASDVAGVAALPLDLQAFRPGATAPTAQTLGTTPTIEALRFDAVAETASAFVAFPPDLDVGVNLELALVVSLTTTETDSDVLSMTLDYVIVDDESTGEGVTRTSTQVLATKTVTTAGGLAAQDVYLITFAIDKDDASNPLAGGAGIGMEIHLTNLTGVAAIDLLGGALKYTSKKGSGLNDLTPASETLTGELWNSKPVYRQTWSGSSLANNTLLQSGVDEIAHYFGRVGGGANNASALPYQDGSNTASVYVNPSNELRTSVTGGFVGYEFRFTIDYTKV